MSNKRGPKPKPRVHPVSWRPSSQELRDLYIAKGGARWLNLLLEVELLEEKAAAVSNKEQAHG